MDWHDYFSKQPALFLAVLKSKIILCKEWFLNHPRKKVIAVGGGIVAVVIIILLIRGVFGGISFFVPTNNYVPIYTLVNEKISQHGGIIINLPKGVSKNGAEEKVSFEPDIQGAWIASSLPDAILYKPSSELTIGKHYLVSFTTDSGVIKKDFLVDEDPAVVSIFPNADAEADPASAITIVFNRPMVPLTTLSELDKKSVPITISPRTPGKFKWISTRTLQFIPDKTLWGSAHYTVSVRPDFVSMDGLSIPAKTYSFTTKNLRLDSTTTGEIVYTQPIRFYFNQPVDLKKTSGEITLTNKTTGSRVERVAQYGKSLVWDSTTNSNKEIEDTKIIDVFPKNSRNGHSNVWEFSTSYTATIKTAYPVGGDIALSGSLFSPVATAEVTTGAVLKSVTVQSEKTDLASAQLFDPAGTASFSFYEDIDIGKSVIRAKGLKKINYGEKCQSKDEGDFSNNCKKVDDKSGLIVSFDSGVYGRGEQILVTFERLVNASGYQVNKDSFSSTLVVYPELRITKSTPVNGTSGASISNLILCTNVPLKPQEAKSFYQNFRANKYIVFGRWNNPYLQDDNQYINPKPCAVGDFVNEIRYGLLPLQSYTVDASVKDVFGQKVSTKLSLKTEQAPKFYLRFQNLQKIYNVTTPDHTKLVYATENFDYVDAFICKVAPGSMVRYLSTQPSDVSKESNSSLPCVSSVTKKIALKNDQWVNQYFQFDIKDYVADTRGQYILSFSHPHYQDEKGNQLFARTYLSVTNIAVAANRVKWSSYDYLPDVPNLTASDTRGSVYWLSSIHSLAPVVGANISVYQAVDRNKESVPPVLARSGTTNTNGFAEFPLIADIVGAAITFGDDSAVVSGWADTLSQGWQSAFEDEKVYLYSDRPIYRPGQQVFLKGLYRINFDGAFKIFRDNDIEITVSDSKGNTVLTQRVPVTAYGTFSTSVTLPASAPLGIYIVSARNNQTYFDVQEYVGSAFEAEGKTNKDEYVAGDTATVSVSGKYYFGVPLDGGTLDYTVTSQNFYFDRYKDEYFNFGSDWYDCYDCGYGDTYLKSGKATLDAKGTTHVELPLDFNALYNGEEGNQSKIFVFHGTVKDKQGKSVSFQKSFIVHRGDYYAGVKADPSFVGATEAFKLRVKTVDLQGKSTSKSGITITVNKVGWQSNKRQEVDGGFYNRPERTLSTVFTKKISTNFFGDYSEQITLKDPGDYQIDVVGKDGHQNEIRSTTQVYVYGKGTVDVQPTNNATLNLTAEKTDLKVGDMATFIIQNPYPHAKALVSIQRGRIFSYEVVDITQSIYRYQFPIIEEYSPNVFASVMLLSPGPEVKFGQVQFTVDRKQKELTIDIRANKASYLPGEKVNLTITTSDAQGRKVPADVSIAVADVSVLALKGNPKKDPLVFFYDGFPLTVTSETNIKNLLKETPIPTGTKGGDGGNPADLATRKRGEFKDTAFWQANVETNEQGVGQVSFTLPDNLTRWQIESLGITKDTKLGVRYQEIVAQKEVMAVPSAPRFIVPGDEFMIGAKIFNQTEKSQSLTVTFESKTLAIEGSSRTEKSVKAGDSAVVYFKVKAPLGMVDGAHTFTLSAKNKNYNDTVERSIPITRNMTYESTASAGSTKDSQIEEYLYLPDTVLKDRGGLTIKTSATLTVYLSDALAYLFEYPYGCSEQLASKLSAIAITKVALAIPNVGSQFSLPKVIFNGTEYTSDQAVTIGLNQIYDNQTIGGGFSYYKGLKPDPYLTMQVLSTLADLKKAGYPVRQNVIEQAVQYLQGNISYFKTHKDTDTLILLAYTLSRVDSGVSTSYSLMGDIAGLATTKYLSDDVSSNTLGYLAILTTQSGASEAFKEKVFATLINRVDIDSRGAYVKTNQKNLGWAYYETPEKNTALFLKALVADGREYAETDNIIRWLLASRSRDGSWGSTNTSVVALDALSDYLRKNRETESSFTLTTTLDSEAVSSTTFTKENILSTIQTFLPILKIEPNKTHVLAFTKTNNNNLPNKFYYDLSFKYYLPVQQIAPRDEGIAITRDFYSLNDSKNIHPLQDAKVGDVVRGVLTIISPKERHLFAVEDYIPAGFELVNFELATEDQSTETDAVGFVPTEETSNLASVSAVTGTFSLKNMFSGLVRDILVFFGVSNSSSLDFDDTETPVVTYQKLYPDFKELRDDRLFLFAENLRPGTYRYEYYLRATTPGKFSHLPAVASEMYFPENFGRTSGSLFTVEE